MTTEASYSWHNKSHFENNELLPQCIRGLLIGSSGCGKTHLLFKLLLEDWVDYNRLYIFSKSLYQPEYQLLIEGIRAKLQPCDIYLLLQNSKDFGELSPKEAVKKLVDVYNTEDPEGTWKSPIEVFAFSDINSIPYPEEVDKNYKNLFIFDDCYLEKQGPIENFYSRGRHSNVQCFYISQNYYKLPRQTIRANANLLILFKLPKIDLTHLYTDVVSIDEDSLNPHCDFDTFRKFCTKVWDQKYQFMVIDRYNDDIDQRYRKGFELSYSLVMKTPSEILK